MGGENTSQQAGGPSWKIADYVAAALLLSFALATNVNTVLNNAYSFGSTLHDSTIFQTVNWRSGWALTPAPVIESISYLNFHLSPILYFPSALSYLVPFDRMTYYGLVYGAVYGSLLAVAFRAFLPLTNGRTATAALGALLFYMSGPVNSGQWEPHEEIASALFMAAFFVAWARRHHWAAAAFLLLNVSVREDCGLILALPLLLLAAHDHWSPRSTERGPERRYSLRYAIASALLSAVSLAVKWTYFNQVDNTDVYFQRNDPFGNLSLALLGTRFLVTIFHGQHLWLPGVVLLIGAARLRDARLAIGWVAFFPYWLLQFLSRLEYYAQLGSYKPFPLVLTVMWPAVLAINSAPERRRRLACLQLGVLLAATVSFEDGGLRFAAPSGIDELAERWALHPETEHAEIYRDFESRLEYRESLGAIRASVGALALYPYNFPRFDRSWVGVAPRDEVEHLDSLLWFEGDRDDETIHEWLKRGHFSYYYRVIGTKLMLATTKPPEALATFTAALQPSAPP